MEFFLRAWLSRILPAGCSFEVHAYRGKSDLLGNLESRLRAYATWLPPEARVIVIVDRDDDECRALKKRLGGAVSIAGLTTRSKSGEKPWKVATRIGDRRTRGWYLATGKRLEKHIPASPQPYPTKLRTATPMPSRERLGSL